MSQILRLSRNFQAKFLSRHQPYLAESVLLCTSCQQLRNEFSTNVRVKPQSVIFKKKKWKKRANLYKKLTQSLDARLVQLSASPGNQVLSRNGNQALQLLGNKTSKDGRVEQNVYFVGKSFDTEQISKLEQEIELLREKKGVQAPVSVKSLQEGTDLAELRHRSDVKLKENDKIDETSTVIDKIEQGLRAYSVIRDKSKEEVLKDNTGDFVNVGYQLSENLVKDTDSNSTELLTQNQLAAKHLLETLTVTKTDKVRSQIQDSDSHFKTSTEELDVENTLVARTEHSKDDLSETKSETRDILTEKKTSKLKVVSKPAHVTPGDKGKVSVNEKGVKSKTDKVKQSKKIKVESKDGVKHSHEKKAKEQKQRKELDKSYEEHTIKIFNKDFGAFVDACCSIGLHRHALDCLHHYRSLNKAGKKRYKVEDVGIYNSIIRNLAQKGDLRSVQKLMAVMTGDCIKPDLQTYAMSLYCLSHNADADPVMVQYILTDMEREGFEVDKIFHTLQCSSVEIEGIVKVLQKAVPGFEVQPQKGYSAYSGPLVEDLNTPMPRSEMVEPNPHAGVVTPKEVLKNAEKQFKRETDSYVYVKPIMPRLTKVVSTDKKNKKQAEPSKEKLAAMKKEWRRELTKGFREKLEELEKKFSRSYTMNLYPYFKLLPEDVYINMLMKEVENLGLVGEYYSPAVHVWYRGLADKILDKYHMQTMTANNFTSKVKKIYSSYTEKILDPDLTSLNHRACWLDVQNEVTNGQSLEIEAKQWSLFVKKALGKQLYEIILNKIKVPVPQKGAGGQTKRMKALATVIRDKEKQLEEEILPHQQFIQIMSAQDNLMFQVSELPMVIPPLPWTTPTQGCNFFSTGKSIRWHLAKQMSMFKEEADGVAVLDSLNVIGACPWKVNKPVLDVIIQVFRNGGDDFLDIPILPSSIEKPRKFKPKTKEDKVKAYKEKLTYKKKELEATGLWYNSLYKFSIANEFRDETFWFPHNMDFRGRTYALPPHFNQHGGDASRAMIKFAKEKPLGPNGLDWLKIHLINLTGLKKRCSLAERLAFANENMEEILDSADNPLEGRRWWTFSDEPWQTLACCMEIAAASRSDDPAGFLSGFPVHQDGSCNGLQHYAALGRDLAGAKSVNLYPFDTPSDVYQDVVELVEKKRQKDLATGDDKVQKTAKMCEGHVERKVIKQTIMTTVYGVTKYGARLQIARQLKDRGMPDSQVKEASTYLADSTFLCLQQMFSSAKQIQDWFNDCATSICGIARKPVEWITPLNFPVIQPYFRPVQGHSYGVSVTSKASLDNEYPSVVKQKNAFAPNFVHSLDSTHMMLTSLYCLRAGITFVSVHDCFWTHPCDVEIMNKVTREQFISLHNQPILENLSKYFVKTFCDTGLDISASEAGNQSRDSNQSDSLSETDQSNNALLETNQSEDVSYLSKQTNQSNSDTDLERDSGLVNGEELNLSDCDLQNGSKLKHLHSDSRNNDSEFADCDSNDTESMYLDSDSIDLESSPSEDLINVEQTRSENEPENTAKHKRNEEGSRHSRKLTEHQKNLFLKKVLTGVPERGDFDLEKVKESTYFFS